MTTFAPSKAPKRRCASAGRQRRSQGVSFAELVRQSFLQPGLYPRFLSALERSFRRSPQARDTWSAFRCRQLRLLGPGSPVLERECGSLVNEDLGVRGCAARGGSPRWRLGDPLTSIPSEFLFHKDSACAANANADRHMTPLSNLMLAKCICDTLFRIEQVCNSTLAGTHFTHPGSARLRADTVAAGLRLDGVRQAPAQEARPIAEWPKFADQSLRLPNDREARRNPLRPGQPFEPIAAYRRAGWGRGVVRLTGVVTKGEGGLNPSICPSSRMAANSRVFGVSSTFGIQTFGGSACASHGIVSA